MKFRRKEPEEEGFLWICDNTKEAGAILQKNKIGFTFRYNNMETTRLFVNAYPGVEIEVPPGSIVLVDYGYARVVSCTDYEVIQDGRQEKNSEQPGNC